MGLFKSKEEKKAIADERDAKYIANHPELYADKAKSDKRFKDGISSVAKPDDYSKIIIEQNDAIINMLTVIAIGQGTISSGGALMYQESYLKKINKIIFGK